MRIGNGYDVHRFGAGGTLRLGGVEIAGAPALDGHSDGDTLIHAVIDALLGAAGAGDIGEHFPPGDPATAGIDSRELLTRVVRLVSARGYRVINVDATVIAERPRLRPHIAAMREGAGVGAGRGGVGGEYQGDDERAPRRDRRGRGDRGAGGGVVG